MSSLVLHDDSECVLSVDSPSFPINFSYTQNSISSTISTSQSPYLEWTVHLERKSSLFNRNGILSVRVQKQCKVNYPGHRCDLLFKAIHFVPRHDPNVSTTILPQIQHFFSGECVEGTVGVDRVLHNDRYLFDIVLTSSTELLRKRLEPLKPLEVLKSSEPLKPVEFPKPSKTAIRNSEFMQALLKDPYSVDIRFVFDTDESYSNVGLWAHRSLLSRYKPFADLIRDASSESAAPTSPCIESEDVINAEMLTIPLRDISPATLCVLLRYIYTGEINRTVDTSLHAISMTESALVMKGISGKPCRFVRWSPMDKDSPWRLKDVTWEELLKASGRFGVSDLQQQCEDAVIASMNASNAVEVLFTVGSTFDKVKESAMDFIVDKMGSVALKDKKPFTAYKNHPNAFEFLVELLARRAP